MAEGQLATPKGNAIALVAMARFMAARDAELVSSLKVDLQRAEKAGIDPADLELLRVVISAADACAGAGLKRF